MRKRILIIILLAIGGLTGFAQHISFVYDDAGNRTARVIVLGPPASAQQQSNNVNPVSQKEITGEKQEIFNDQLEEMQFKIFPNPTEGLLSIEINHYKPHMQGKVQVFDISGQLILSITELSPHMQVNISNKPAGTYIMILSTGAKKSEWKIVKK